MKYQIQMILTIFKRRKMRQTALQWKLRISNPNDKKTQSNVCEREPKNGVQLQMNIQKLFLFFFICLYAADMNLCYYYKLCAYRIVKWQMKKEEMKRNAREMTTNNDELPSLNTSKNTVRKKWCTEKNARKDNVPNQSKNRMLFVL